MTSRTFSVKSGSVADAWAAMTLLTCSTDPTAVFDALTTMPVTEETMKFMVGVVGLSIAQTIQFDEYVNAMMPAELKPVFAPAGANAAGRSLVNATAVRFAGQIVIQGLQDLYVKNRVVDKIIRRGSIFSPKSGGKPKGYEEICRETNAAHSNELAIMRGNCQTLEIVKKIAKAIVKKDKEIK